MIQTTNPKNLYMAFAKEVIKLMKALIKNTVINGKIKMLAMMILTATGLRFQSMPCLDSKSEQ